MSALRVTACLFSVEIIPIDTKKRKMPESLVFTSRAPTVWGGAASDTPGEEMMRAAQPEPAFSSEILNLNLNQSYTLYTIQGV